MTAPRATNPEPLRFRMTPGAVVAPAGRVLSVMAFTVTNGKITQIDALADPERLGQLSLAIPPLGERRR